MKRPPLWIPLLFLAIGTVFFMANPGADLAVSGAFFNAETQTFDYNEKGWVQFIYNAANKPFILLVSTAAVLALISIWKPRLRDWRLHALFYALAVSIGPGIIVNSIFKEHYGRPRPREIVEFGGEKAFCQLWEPGIRGNGFSFPSGHASVGFFAMAPGFVLWQRRRRLAWLVLAAGFVFGGIVGLGRIMQGGHFASDVLWAFGFTYFTGLATAYALGYLRRRARRG